MKTCQFLSDPDHSVECGNLADWGYIGDPDDDHVCCDACFSELDPDHQLEYEPLLEREYPLV